MDGARVVAVPMAVRFRGVTTREAVLLPGPVGWGEFAAFTEYDDRAAASWLAAALEAAAVGWPAPARDRVPVNATVPAVAPADVAGVLARFQGCRTAKVKVAEHGQGLDDDRARVGEVRRLLGPDGRLRVDANGAWSVDEAVEAITALARHRLEYVEQPCTTLPEMAALRVALARRHVDVLLAADESVRTAADPQHIAGLEAADVVVLKVPPLGGVAPALAVAQACALPVVVSSALDTSVGIAAGLALAAALPDLPFDCGLATAHLLADDVAQPAPLEDGALRVGAVAPDPVALDRLAAPPDRQRWWLARLARCRVLLRA